MEMDEQQISSFCTEQQNLEWLRKKLGTLWQASEYCGLCLETMGNFYPINMKFAINECYSTKSLREIISAVLHCDIKDYTSSEIICKQCIEKTIMSYVFIENTKNMFNILNSCVSDLLSKATDVENQWNEIGTYKDANAMIVVELDKETNNNIEKLTVENDKTLIEKLLKRLECIRKITAPKKKKLLEIANNETHEIIPAISKKHTRSEDIPMESMATVKIKKPKISIAGDVKNFPAPNIKMGTSNDTSIYQCKLCSKKYITQKCLDDHYTFVHTKSRCRYCHDFFNNDELNNHLKEKHPEEVNIYKYCDLVYYTEEQLETHCTSAHVYNDLQNNNEEAQCVMCLKNFKDVEIKMHKCKFSCLECPVVPCVHHRYLMSYREQVLSHSTKIKCLECDFVIKRKKHLIAHVNREHIDYHPYTCDDCGTQFYTKLSLKIHIVQFHQDLKCHYCDRVFKSRPLLINHKELCKDITRKLPCKQCIASFDMETELEKHIQLHHSKVIFPCILCKKEFTSNLSFKEHCAKVHNGVLTNNWKKIIECTLCDITFTSVKEMLAHEELHDPNELFICKVCLRSFHTLKKMHFHTQRHYNRKIKCLSCKKFITASYFNRHRAVCRNLQPRDLQYTCSECSMAFHTKYALYAHKKLHQKPCAYCNKVITSSMEKHIANNHSKKRRPLLKCDYCDYTTTERNGYDNHMNKIHLKIKPYVCHICSKAFCGKTRLLDHMKTHTDEYVCFCSYCGKQFANRVCLKMHIRHHTGEKPYECNICFKRFESSSIMKKHRLKKHQAKTIQCPLCGSMHHLLPELRRHVKTVHWKRPEPFDYKELVSEEYYHLFQDQRLQKLGEDIRR